jgi:hypothetical protein
MKTIPAIDYDWIEIGTSDFETEGRNPNTSNRGALVEPISMYLDALPNGQNTQKVNAAVCAFDGTATVFNIDPSIISQHNLPEWLRGCNSMFTPHPLSLTELKSRGLDPEKLITKTEVETITWHTLVKRLNVGRVKYLKIDTEGGDCEIVSQVLRLGAKQPTLLPHKIMFETNANTPKKSVIEIIMMLKIQGYKVLSEGENTVVELIEKSDKALLLPKIILLTESTWALGRISMAIIDAVKSVCDIRFLGWESSWDWKSVLSSNDFKLLVVQTLGTTCEVLKLYPKLVNKLLTVCHGPIEYSDKWISKLCLDTAISTGLPIGCVSEEIVNTLASKGLNSFLTPCGVDTKMFTRNNINESTVIKVLFPRRISNDCHFDTKRTKIAKLLIEYYKNNAIVVVECLDRLYKMDEMVDIYRKYDCLLILSKSEGNPLSILEGGACGAVSISTSVGIIPTVINDGVDGFIIDGETDDEILASAISKIDMLSVNRELLSNSQKAITEKIHNNYSWDNKSDYWKTFILKGLEKSSSLTN